MYKVIVKGGGQRTTEEYMAFGNIPQRIRAIQEFGVRQSQARFNYSIWKRDIAPEEIEEIKIVFPKRRDI